MPWLENFIDLGAPAILLLVVLYYWKEHLKEEREWHLKLQKEKNTLELEARKRVDDTMITWIKDIVATVTRSNDKHSDEHKSILIMLEEKEKENSKDHREISFQIKKNTENIEMLHEDIKKTHEKCKKLWNQKV